jgi:DNA-binding response OmpR family regulator
MNELILVVEDEPKIAKLARDYLEGSNYKVLVVSMSAGRCAANRMCPSLC